MAAESRSEYGFRYIGGQLVKRTFPKNFILGNNNLLLRLVTKKKRGANEFIRQRKTA